MVKIHIKNEKLYVNKAGKDTEIDSVTIYHDKNKGTYDMTAFLYTKGKGNEINKYKQKTYPIPGITLKQVQDPESLVSRRGVYYHLKSKNFYINYYVK